MAKEFSLQHVKVGESMFADHTTLLRHYAHVAELDTRELYDYLVSHGLCPKKGHLVLMGASRFGNSPFYFHVYRTPTHWVAWAPGLEVKPSHSLFFVEMKVAATKKLTGLFGGFLDRLSSWTGVPIPILCGFLPDEVGEDDPLKPLRLFTAGERGNC